jgi:hypothetical protein
MNTLKKPQIVPKYQLMVSLDYVPGGIWWSSFQYGISASLISGLAVRGCHITFDGEHYR